MNRRDFIKVGSVAGINLSLADYMYLEANDKVNKNAKANSVIYIYLPEGMLHKKHLTQNPYRQKNTKDRYSL